jgi:2-dehydro-3-deoxyphosphogluconate aldolase/(4S)-4-hydroxy-2-oxoglutarate aldolase
LDLVDRLRGFRLLPLVQIADARDAIPLAEALAAGGLPCVEVAFRTPAAADALARIRHALPNLLLGAGTVLTPAAVDVAAAAGADFVVSPGCAPAVIDRALDCGLGVIPGVATASEVQSAFGRGLRLVKFFPAESIGGTGLLRALTAPFPMMSFVPTGGIDESNLDAYLDLEAVAAVGGSWMAPRARIETRDFDAITELVAKAVARVREHRQA